MEGASTRGFTAALLLCLNDGVFRRNQLEQKEGRCLFDAWIAGWPGSIGRRSWGGDSVGVEQKVGVEENRERKGEGEKKEKEGRKGRKEGLGRHGPLDLINPTVDVVIRALLYYWTKILLFYDSFVPFLLRYRL